MKTLSKGLERLMVLNTLISKHNVTKNLSFNLDEKIAATLGQLSTNNILVLQTIDLNNKDT